MTANPAIDADPSAKPPQGAAVVRPQSDDASAGWFESTWDLRRGLEICEDAPLDQEMDDAINARHRPAHRQPTLTNFRGDNLKGYFQLQSNAGGRYSFNLKAGNHEVILTSQVYKTKEDVLEAVDSVRKNSANPMRYQRKLSTDSSPFFVLLSEDGETLGRSEIYLASAAMENGIASVMSNGPTTAVRGLE